MDEDAEQDLSILDMREDGFTFKYEVSFEEVSKAVTGKTIARFSWGGWMKLEFTDGTEAWYDDSCWLLRRGGA